MQRILFSLLLVSLLALQACTKNEKPDARVVVTTGSHDQLIKLSAKPIALDFWASWCGPCQMMDPIFAEVAVERPDIVFGKVNVDQEPKLAQKYEIHAIPTLLAIVDGKLVKTSVGVLPKKALLQLLDEVVKKTPQSTFLAREIVEPEKSKLDGLSAHFDVPYRFYVGTKTEFSDFIEQNRAFDSLGEDLGQS